MILDTMEKYGKAEDKCLDIQMEVNGEWCFLEAITPRAIIMSAARTGRLRTKPKTLAQTITGRFFKGSGPDARLGVSTPFGAPTLYLDRTEFESTIMGLIEEHEAGEGE